MDNKSLSAWLRFSRISLTAGPARKLLTAFGSPEAVLDASPDLLESFDIRDIVSRVAAAKAADIDWDLRTVEKLDIDLVPFTDERYPTKLAEIKDPPALLFVRGDITRCEGDALAVVGSRRHTHYGRKITAEVAGGAAKAGIIIVSGGAAGIDTAAHEAALGAGGVTVSVLGCGIDIAYPTTNARLYDKIAETGAVISEYPIGFQATNWTFPQRNRIISGLSDGVLVIGAPANSGALITADYARKQGREVFAVPGNVDDPRNAGSLRLIKEGARVVMSAEDVCGFFAKEAAPEAVKEIDLTEEERAVFNIIDFEPILFDDIAAAAGEVDLASVLLSLEIKGVIARLPGNQYIRN